MIAALIASVVLHSTAPAPAAQLAAVLRTATFRVLTLPPSMQLLRADVSRDGAAARLEYSVEGAVVVVAERAAMPASDLGPVPDGEQAFNLDGYLASYVESGAYRGESALSWFRPDVTVSVTSRDRVSEPMLVDVALSLR